MKRLRQQVDKIDLKLLSLLQQRTKLSGEIGRAKRRHGAEIYVPNRERELFARVAALAGDALPKPAAKAIFREIISSSRAAQGQGPIGFLARGAAHMRLVARCHFGACDRFVTKKSWREIETDLKSGDLAVALLTARELAVILGNARTRGAFLSSMTIAGEISPDEIESFGERIYILKGQRPGDVQWGNRALVLIECKITAIAVKSLLNSMPYRPIQTEQMSLPSPSGASRVGGLMALTFARPVDDALQKALSGARVKNLIVGIYPGDEVYGG